MRSTFIWTAFSSFVLGHHFITYTCSTGRIKQLRPRLLFKFISYLSCIYLPANGAQITPCLAVAH